MKSIEQIANDFLAAYDSGNEEDISRKANIFVKEIKRDEWQFKNVVHFYAIARAMYYLLEVDYRLSDRDCEAIIRLIYYCLLKNYSQNNDLALTDDSKYADVIGGCELAFVVMCQNGQALIYRILSGALGYMPNIAQKHIVDQMLLFAGIVKEANEKDYYHFLDTNISKQFNSLLQEVYENIPVGEELQSYKDNCASIINTISKDLELGFSYEEDDYEFF